MRVAAACIVPGLRIEGASERRTSGGCFQSCTGCGTLDETPITAVCQTEYERRASAACSAAADAAASAAAIGGWGGRRALPPLSTVHSMGRTYKLRIQTVALSWRRPGLPTSLLAMNIPSLPFLCLTRSCTAPCKSSLLLHKVILNSKRPRCKDHFLCIPFNASTRVFGHQPQGAQLAAAALRPQGSPGHRSQTCRTHRRAPGAPAVHMITFNNRAAS